MAYQKFTATTEIWHVPFAGGQFSALNDSAVNILLEFFE